MATKVLAWGLSGLDTTIGRPLSEVSRISISSGTSPRNSTPQYIALLDARKGLNLFRKVEVPVLGIIENMSLFVCPNCGHETHIFSHGGARLEAEKLGVEFLGEVPLDIEIRETSDSGRPIVVSRPDSPHAKTFVAMAERIRDKVTAQDGTRRQAPKIVMQ